MTIPQIQSSCAWVSFIAIVLGAMASNSVVFLGHPIPGDLTSPVLAIELMHSPEDVNGIVGPPGDPRRAAMNHLTWIDLFFIPAYAVLFSLVGFLLIRQSHARVGTIVIVLGIVGASFDILEDLDIFRALRGAGISPRHWSIPKWSILFVAMGMLVPVYRSYGQPYLHRFIGYSAAILSLFAAMLGLEGVLLQTDPLIESGGRFMGLSLVAGFLFFATHKWLSSGLVPALDQLAALPFFRALAKWPNDEVDDELWPSASPSAGTSIVEENQQIPS
jgi:hypothetical protein